MDSNLSVLLRDVAHDASGVKLALKVEQLSISISRTPIQIPVPGGEPELIDLGFRKNDLVGFSPNSEYEFTIDNERLYRVTTNSITIKYEYQGKEEEYNPSWV